MSTNGNVTVEAIKQQIADTRVINTPNANRKTFDVKDYLDTRLKPGETTRKVRIRVLPVSETDNRLCVEVKIHSLKVDKKIAESGFKSFVCLNDEQIPNYNKDVRCPLCSKAFELFKSSKELRNQGRTAESDPIYNRARDLMNKSTYIMRVIDRSKEDEGVKFWRFNKNTKGEGIFDKLINLYENKQDDYKADGRGEDYNIFDVNNGRDIILTIKRTYSKEGKELTPSYQIDVADRESPLSTNPELAEKWITDTKKWYNAYTSRTPEYLSIIADGDIPVKNEDGVWVSESVMQAVNEQRAEERKTVMDESQKILDDVTPSPTIFNGDANIDDGLPF